MDEHRTYKRLTVEFPHGFSSKEFERLVKIRGGRRTAIKDYSHSPGIEYKFEPPLRRFDSVDLVLIMHRMPVKSFRFYDSTPEIPKDRE